MYFKRNTMNNFETNCKKRLRLTGLAEIRLFEPYL